MKLAKNMNEEEIESVLKTINHSLLPSCIRGIKSLTTLSKILHYRIKHGSAIYKFCNGLTDTNFSFDRFFQYQKYRTTKKTDSYSTMYYQLKYGNEWKQHYQLRQAARTSPYSVEHYTSKGLTEQEANEQISLLKEKTSPSVEKFIRKYGEVAGKQKFNEKFRRHKNYLEYWIKKTNGNIMLAELLFDNYKKLSSPKCVDFYLKKGFTKEKAIELISKHQLENAGVHRQYYENKGYTDVEIDAILEQINRKKDSASIDFIKVRYPEENAELFYEQYNKLKSSRYRDKGVLVKDDPAQPAREIYYEKVKYYTRMNVHLLDECPGVPGRHVGNYHIDHIFSVDAGFRNNIDPRIIGSIVNLRWMICEENTSKKQRCDIKLEELLRKYEDYENCKN